MMRVALTFDDGPGPSTSELLDVLAAHGARATFFVLGKHARAFPHVLVRIAEQGHVIGNHSFSHPYPADTTARAFEKEIEETDAVIAEILGAKSIGWQHALPVRLPYGPFYARDPRAHALRMLGRPHVHWTGTFSDWEDPPVSKLCGDIMLHILRQQAQDLEAVLCLHDASPGGAPRVQTVAAVRRILENTRFEHFTVPRTGCRGLELALARDQAPPSTEDRFGPSS